MTSVNDIKTYMPIADREGNVSMRVQFADSGDWVSAADLRAYAEQRDNRVAELEESEEQWRNLALQFDGHRMAALGHLRCMLNDAEKHGPVVRKFLADGPLSGEEVLAQRIAASAQVSQPVGVGVNGLPPLGQETIAIAKELGEDPYVRQFQEYLNSVRMSDISSEFHRLVKWYRASLAAPAAPLDISGLKTYDAQKGN